MPQLEVVNDRPFSLCPFFGQGALDNAFSEYLTASCSDIATLVIVQERWHFGITVDLALCGKSKGSEDIALVPLTQRD